ncbi:hypothetical protein K438DRAFT_1985244 [Mycena galopus ATCC 62051]|nr:hypothetical protein K438DRAFT_1985244 [Mycena galopus ATCC 62051]
MTIAAIRSVSGQKRVRARYFDDSAAQDAGVQGRVGASLISFTYSPRNVTRVEAHAVLAPACLCASGIARAEQ